MIQHTIVCVCQWVFCRMHAGQHTYVCYAHAHGCRLYYGLVESYSTRKRSVLNPREIRNHRSRISVYYAVAVNLQVPTRTPPYCTEAWSMICSLILRSFLVGKKPHLKLQNRPGTARHVETTYETCVRINMWLLQYIVRSVWYRCILGDLYRYRIHKHVTVVYPVVECGTLSFNGEFTRYYST